MSVAPIRRRDRLLACLLLATVGLAWLYLIGIVAGWWP